MAVLDDRLAVVSVLKHAVQSLADIEGVGATVAVGQMERVGLGVDVGRGERVGKQRRRRGRAGEERRRG